MAKTSFFRENTLVYVFCSSLNNPIQIRALGNQETVRKVGTKLVGRWCKVGTPLINYNWYETGTMATLHIIFIPGGCPNVRKNIRHPQGSRKWDWAILTHGNGRYGYYQKLVFWSKIEKCKQFFQQPDLGLWWDFTPRVSRPDKTNPPPGADFSISPSGFNYDMQSIFVCAFEESLWGLAFLKAINLGCKYKRSALQSILISTVCGNTKLTQFSVDHHIVWHNCI